jgi:hypothetical protein
MLLGHERRVGEARGAWRFPPQRAPHTVCPRTLDLCIFELCVLCCLGLVDSAHERAQKRPVVDRRATLNAPPFSSHRSAVHGELVFGCWRMKKDR